MVMFLALYKGFKVTVISCLFLLVNTHFCMQLIRSPSFVLKAKAEQAHPQLIQVLPLLCSPPQL